MSLRAPLRGTRRRLLSDAALYDRTAEAAAAQLIRHYSSSFGLACRLLDQPVRDRIRNVYALVRLADEVVDGSVGVRDPAQAGLLLDRLEHETGEALRSGYSTNLVVHAFARSARACGIEEDLTAPFFASMRADLTVREHDGPSFDTYVHGSAEVVGLMCLRVFLTDPAPLGPGDGPPPTPADDDDLEVGARRLGAAFQKINFLRDLTDDLEERGRCYFPGLDPDHLTEVDKHRILDDIDADLAAAAVAARRLPRSSRRAVVAAHALFSELARRLRSTPASSIREIRVRVPTSTKAWIAVRALASDSRL